MKHTKRFRIWLSNGIQRTTEARFDTISEVIRWCQDNEEKAMLDPYWVECLVDEIEVQTDELMEAWARGERPEDLQMF